MEEGLFPHKMSSFMIIKSRRKGVMLCWLDSSYAEIGLNCSGGPTFVWARKYQRPSRFIGEIPVINRGGEAIFAKV